MRSFLLPAVLLSCALPLSLHAEPPTTPGRVELITAPANTAPAEALIRSEMDRATANQKNLVVYVGAPWCEPCTRFHEAVEMGALDAVFPTLRLLEFDYGRDKERLSAAGYTSRLIPLFAIPAADGRASGRQFAGSIKGPGAISNIVPRLKRLLENP